MEMKRVWNKRGSHSRMEPSRWWLLLFLIHLLRFFLISPSNMWFNKLSIIVSVTFLFLSFFWYSYVGNAADCIYDPEQSATDFLDLCGTDSDYIPVWSTWADWVREKVTDVAKTALWFAALFAIGAIVWSGIQYTISYGDDEKIKKAKSTATFALIWLIIALTSFSLVSILVNFIYERLGW